ncbi:MAG: glycoside hydrolase family 36 protein [Leptospiraceae bacterium]|nr:glycoside hydrolase family 36 protein [Leptospiraceae bacterium]
MNRAKLQYQIFGKKYQTEFTLQSKNKSEIDSSFRFQIQEKKLTKGEISYQTSLGWESIHRPPVGLKINTLSVELNLPESEKEGPYSIFQHGYQSWSFSTIYSEIEKDVSPLLQFLRTSEENYFTKHSGKKGDFQSEGFIVLWSKQNQKGFLLGVTSPGTENVKFRVKLNERGGIETIEAIFDLFLIPEFKAKEPFELTQFKFVSFAETPSSELEKYALALGKKSGVKKNTNPVPTGWCSWYYYFLNISEKIILENLNELKTKKLPVQFFQIDDGYEKEIGEWLVPNEKFPAGMGFLANEIRKAGLEPGIWLAPFLLRKEASFFKMYPEAVLKDEKGNPIKAIFQPIWGSGYTYAMDVTHPASIEYLEKVFKTFVKEYGYNYLKLDFLYAGALDGVAYNSKISPAKRYRDAIEMIRKIVGKNVFLLGCGAPMIQSIGVFDGMRVSCDVMPFWYPQRHRVWLRDKHALCTEKALINGLNRSFMHRNFWLNDPDCLIIRRDKNKMSYEQTILMATVMAISGGMLLMSDNLSTLDTARLPIFEKSLELSALCQNSNSIPLGFLEYKFPRGFYNSSGVLGLWNPTKFEEEVTIDFPFPNLIESTPDFWTGEKFTDYTYDKNTKKLTFKLKGFKSVVFLKK